MKAIFLTNSELEQLPVLYATGYESIVYIYKNTYALKIYNTNDKNILNNKLNKIRILKDINTHDILPVSLVFIDNEFKGYASIYQPSYVVLDCLKQRNKTKYIILNTVLEHIQKLNSLGIIFGDIKESNILFNPSTLDVMLCDLDGAYVKGLNFDYPHIFQSLYLRSIPKIDEKMDAYLFNLFTVSYVQNIYYPLVLENLRKCGLKGKLNTPENNIILSETLTLNDDFSGDLFINHTKKRILF